MNKHTLLWIFLCNCVKHEIELYIYVCVCVCLSLSLSLSLFLSPSLFLSLSLYLSPSVPIIHHSWHIPQTLYSILTELK